MTTYFKTYKRTTCPSTISSSSCDSWSTGEWRMRHIRLRCLQRALDFVRLPTVLPTFEFLTIFSGEIHLLSHNQMRDGQLPKITKGPNMEKLKVSSTFPGPKLGHKISFFCRRARCTTRSRTLPASARRSTKDPTTSGRCWSWSASDRTAGRWCATRSAKSTIFTCPTSANVRSCGWTRKSSAAASPATATASWRGARTRRSASSTPPRPTTKN